MRCMVFGEPTESVGPTFFRSAARGLTARGSRRVSVAQNEARKRRANERPRVGCCEELARPSPTVRAERANRTIKDHYFRLLGGGTLPERAERAPATRR